MSEIQDGTLFLPTAKNANTINEDVYEMEDTGDVYVEIMPS